ncbi:MAG: 3-hydroxyacyl-ACP dehydratase FabZ [Oligoflexales bacterium]|nr:3-hydroxyacyl-ACP dehydratase FabZ [Oligoflexales bacterium]
MENKSLNLPFSVLDIQKCIPHRYPFLLIDTVTAIVLNESIVALKNVSISDPILQGHFPEAPIYPGVLIIEGMAQASAVLGYFSNQEEGRTSKQVLLTEVSKSRFKRKVEPGDVLRYEVKVLRRRAPFFWFEGYAFVGEESVASAHFSALMK